MARHDTRLLYNSRAGCPSPHPALCSSTRAAANACCAARATTDWSSSTPVSSSSFRACGLLGLLVGAAPMPTRGMGPWSHTTRGSSHGWMAGTRGPISTAALESDVEACSCHDRGVHIREPVARVECFLEARIDDLQVDRRVEPGRERGVVVHLDRVLVVETEVEPLAQERNEVAAEFGARPADAEVVVRTPGHHSVAADTHVVGVLDGVRVSVGGAEREEDPDPALGVAGRLPEILVEVVEDGPGVALAVRRLDGDEELGEELLEDTLQDRARIGKSRKLVEQGDLGDVGRVL